MLSYFDVPGNNFGLNNMTGLSLEALLPNTETNEKGPGHWNAGHLTRHSNTSPNLSIKDAFSD